MLTFDFDKLGIERGHRLLDLGCGAGRHTFEALKRGAQVVSADLDDVVLKDVAGMVAALRSEGEIAGVSWGGVNCDALCLPFSDGAFDRVVVSEIFEHIPHHGLAAAEIARVLKPGGRAVVTVPRWWPERICWALSRRYHDVPGGHVRIYRRGALSRLLLGAGLDPYATHHAHAFHAPYWWIKCAVGVDRDQVWPVRTYHRFLVGQMPPGRTLGRTLEHLLDPVLGKSFVVYVTKAVGR